jgi:hypothetical protein
MPGRVDARYTAKELSECQNQLLAVKAATAPSDLRQQPRSALSATSDSNAVAIATSFTAQGRESSKVLGTVAPSAGNLHGARVATSAMRFRAASGASVTGNEKSGGLLPPYMHP